MGDDIVVGVGSVLKKDTAIEAVNAGAKFVVSPIVKPEIISTARDMGVPVMPGAFTPTEIQAAFEEGADIVKVFPADNLGLQYFKNVIAPMPHLKLMPTGGVSLTNAGDWLEAGACAVGVGSALLDKKALTENNYSKLTENAEILINSIESYRSK
jgi:2-dehydro-3-deoxyphosphogluconate aldolase/(4S)-4-hydroxy-2-oxoglutarate aldolase